MTWRRHLNRFLAWVRLRIPRALRVPLGILLIILGIFGFLPILGFWMIPLGVAVLAIDIKPVRTRLRARKKR